MTQTTPYERALASKRAWQPTKVEAGYISPVHKDAIMRGLALRCLELPVAEWLGQGLKRDLPKTRGILEVLQSNMKDEERHDEALGYVAEAHGTDPRTENTARGIQVAWQGLPDHPLEIVSVLERAVFFTLLPFNRRHGDFGLRTVSADISRDERVHAGTHTRIVDELGGKPSQSLDALRIATIEWFLGDHPDREFWRRVSDNLMYNRKAPELSFTKATRQPAFFEASNSNLPNYGT